ncbi:MAG: hypothetical protein ACRDAU_12540 [Clostridium sp.]
MNVNFNSNVSFYHAVSFKRPASFKKLSYSSKDVTISNDMESYFSVYNSAYDKYASFDDDSLNKEFKNIKMSYSCEKERALLFAYINVSKSRGLIRNNFSI